MTDEHRRTIEMMDEFYSQYGDGLTSLDLAERTCDACNLYPEDSYRIPAWVMHAAQMIIAIEAEAQHEDANH